MVATATIAAEIGLGGLGRYIIDGLATSNYGEVAGGAVLVVILALLVQVVFVGLRYLVVPAPLRAQARAQLTMYFRFDKMEGISVMRSHSVPVRRGVLAGIAICAALVARGLR